MKKLVKLLSLLLSIAFIALLSSALLGAIALYFLLKPETIKQLIIKQAAATTGRILTIDRFDWKLFPTLRMQIDQATLSNPAGFPGQQPFIQLNHASIGLKVLPLLHKKIEASTIDLNGLTINLMQNKNGEVNWQNLNQQTTNNPKKTVSIADKNNHDVVYSTAISTPAINITELNLTYWNKKTGQRSNIDDLNFFAQHVVTGQSFPFQTSLIIEKNNPLVKTILQSSGNLIINPKNHELKIQDVNLQSKMLEAGRTQQFYLTHFNADIHFNHSLITIQPFSVNFYNGYLSGAVSINLSNATPRYTTNLRLIQLDTQLLLGDLLNSHAFSGTAFLNATLQTQGKTSDDLLNHLQGSGDIRVTNCQFLGINIGAIYQNAVSLITKGRPSSLTGLNDTGLLRADFTLNQGILATPNLSYFTPDIKITGNGNANLTNQQVNFKINIVGITQENKTNKENGPIIPFTVSGSFNSPSITPNLTSLFKDQLEQRLTNELHQLPNQTKNLTNQLKNINLKSLFN